MITGQIHKAHTVDFDKFKFGEVTVNKYGGKSNIKTNSKGKSYELSLINTIFM